jgi:aminomethyltransferase
VDIGVLSRAGRLCYHPHLFTPQEDAPLPDSQARRSPLHEVHVAAGARLVDFAGWRMPIQYTGVIDEHRTVRERAGLFDVSHMGEARVRGAEAESYLQRLTCNDVARLRPGRAQYTALTTENGCFVDDMLIYQLDDSDYLLVLNAGNTDKDLGWLRSHRESFDASLDDESLDWALLALQGPQAETILKTLTEVPLQDLRYYGVARAAVGGVDCIISRTGYTGEDGFELYTASAEATQLWYDLLGAGAPHGLIPAGLGARDTLRLEAGMALYGNDIDETTTVYEADLGWIVKLKKGDFIGREALARQAEQGVTRKLVGFTMHGRAIARHGFPALREGEPVGRVTSGSFSPTLEKSIGLAYLPLALTEPGSGFEVDIRGRSEPATVVETPFYKRKRQPKLHE